MTALLRRELRALIGGGMLPLFLAVTLGGTGLSVFYTCVYGASPAFANGSLYQALAMALACGLAGMGAFSAERRHNTERWLYALPVSTAAIALAKLIARWAMVLLAGLGMTAFAAAMSVAAPSIHFLPALSGVLAVTALGLVFMSVAVFCSAASRYAAGALAAFALLTAAAYAMPLAAERVSQLTSLSIPTLIMGLAVVVLLIYGFTSDALIACVTGAIVEVPSLLACLSGHDTAVIDAVVRAMESAAVFDGLTPFINGLPDLRQLVIWLAIAALFAVLTVTAAAARRHGKRRALS